MQPASVILSIIRQYHQEQKSATGPQYMARTMGVLEGILMERGILEPGQRFDLKRVACIRKRWFRRSVVTTRYETYDEHILRLAKENLIY
jgi:hypothetical protein